MQSPLETMRKFRRETRREIAQQMKVHHTTIFRYEKNEIFPVKENFVFIANYCQLDLENMILTWMEWSELEDANDTPDEFKIKEG